MANADNAPQMSVRGLTRRFGGTRRLYGADAWQRFGGSVATHPLVLAQLAEMADIPVRYLGWYQGDQLKAAIPTWDRYLALSKDVLKRAGKKGLFDIGNAELIDRKSVV